MHAIRSPRRRAQAASAEFRGCRLEVDHQLELGRSWAWRPHAEASYQPWLRWFRLRTAFCDFLEAATGCWGSSLVASLVDAVTAIALRGTVCGELEVDAVPCRLFGALIAGEAGESVVPGLRGIAAMTDLPSTL